MKKSDPMLEAHVQFELKRWQARSLKKTVREEVGAALDWLAEVKLNEIASAEFVMDWVQRNVVDRPITPEVTDLIRRNVQATYEFLDTDATTVEEVVPRELYDRVIEVVIDLQALRRHVTHQLVTSSVYSMLIANVLYQGIKGFILTENVFARKIPGASSLVRLGQNALNAAAPKLEKGIDEQLVRFINSNIHQTVTDSEKFLDKSLDPKMIRKLADEAWDNNAQERMADLTEYVDAGSVEVVTGIVQDFWLHYRDTAFFWTLVQELVDSFFARYGDRDIRSILADMGLDEATLVQEATLIVTPVVEKALASGYLEQRIRRRLSPFYASQRAATPDP